MSLNLFLSGTAALLCTALAMSVVFRRRRTVSSFFFFAGMLMLGAESILQGISLEALSAEGIEYWQSTALILKSLLLGIWFCFSMTYSRGDYSRFLKRGWLLLLGFLCPLGLAIWFRTDLVRALPFSETDATWWLGFLLPGKILNLLLLVGTVLILMNLERTLRSAVGTVRWRIKFVVLGLGVIFGVGIYTRSQDLLFSGHQLALAGLETGAVVIGCLLVATAYFHRGFKEVDVYPSRAVLHTSLTVLLVGAYLFAVGILAQLVGRFGGARSFQLQALFLLIGIVVLAVLFLSEKVRLRIRVFVSRNFKRPQHDVRRVWTRLTACMAGPQDPFVLSAAVARLLSETFNALSVSIWLANPQSERLIFAASTSGLPGTTDGTGGAVPSLAGTSVEKLQGLTSPFDLETSKDEGAANLRELSTGQFSHGGHRIGVPLRTGDRWLGVAILADRVNGVPYAVEELDLLECIGEQVAAGLLNLRLAAEMAAGKELEAVQNISAFFAHDLKNAASTLGLMLTNLPVHFGDPEFRQDALRGIGSTVNRINQLISRAGELQRGLVIRSTAMDLNALLTEAVEQVDQGGDIRWVKNLRSMPEMTADREQLQSVVTNLLLNAGDAVGDDGTVTVETNFRDGWAEILVTDNGCGMTPEFLQKALFRPLRTTKKKGLGIGMFQSKMIIEAHGGKITAISQPGVGTTFRVLLPSK
jgi:putative PEP-CTERM system histidine kinase